MVVGAMQVKVCRRCNHRWTPRVQNPRKCPACWSAKWQSK